jgi:hypothetical protein
MQLELLLVFEESTAITSHQKVQGFGAKPKTNATRCIAKDVVQFAGVMNDGSTTYISLRMWQS